MRANHLGNNILVKKVTSSPFDSSTNYRRRSMQCVLMMEYILCVLGLLSLVGHAAAGCNRPPRPNNGRYSWSRRSRSRYDTPTLPDGSVLQYTCNSHYDVANNGIRRCVSGSWTGPDEMCVVKKCPIPEVSDHVVVHLDAEGAVLTLARFSCDEGYRLVGKAKVKCNVHQRWKNSFPRCEAAAYCGDPGLLPVMTREGECCYQGDTLIYSCPAVLELQGSASITCQANGQWSAPAPHCNDTQVCPALPSVDNGNVTYSRGFSDVMWPGDNVTVTCKLGYYVYEEYNYEYEVYEQAYEGNQISTTLRCGANGQWSGDMPSCAEWSCEVRTAPIGGGIRSNATSLRHGEVIEYYCDEGYDMIGVSQQICSAATFSLEPVQVTTCERIKCPMIDALENGYIIGSTYYLNDTLYFECNDGFDRVGPANKTCMETRKWTGSIVTCDQRNANGWECPNPGIPAGAMKAGSQYNIGNRVAYQCRGTDLTLVGKPTIECLSGGEWDADPPICESLHTFETPEEAAAILAPNWDLLKFQTSTSTLEGRRGRLAHLLGLGLDLYFVLDASGSITPANFRDLRLLIRKLVTEVGIGDVNQPASTRVGIISFSTNFTVHLFPNDPLVRTVEQVLQKLDGITHNKGSTCMTCALKRLRRVIIPSVRRSRKNTKIAIVILSDGKVNIGQDPVEEANLLKEKKIGAEIFAIGVSNQVDRDKLRNVASDDSNGHQHMFTLQKFYHMDALVSLLTTGAADYSSCGTTADDPSRRGRVFGGVDVPEGKWRWMTALYFKKEGDKNETTLAGKIRKYDLMCGGSLISDQTVLTAAHCVHGKHPDDVYIKAGRADLNDPKSKAHEQIKEVERIDVHVDYDPDTYRNDVALLHLKTAVKLNPYVGVICLPDKEGVNQNELYNLRRQVTVTGWGRTHDSVGTTTTEMQEISLPYTPEDDCKELGEENPIDLDLFFCAGNGQLNPGLEYANDTCGGDSGGPAVRNVMTDSKTRETRWVQTGLVSWGQDGECGRENQYGVYVRLLRYAGWIRDNM